MTQVISSVLYRIASCKRSMVAHHDSLKLCSVEDLLAEMTEEGLEQRSQTQEMPYGDKASPDVRNDDDHELFEDYIEIDDTQRETTRTRRGRVIKRPTYLEDYGV